MSDAHAVARGPFEALSPEHIFYCSVKRSPGWKQDEGVSVIAMTEALREDGQMLESGWPYLSTLPSDLSLWRPPANAMPAYRRETASSNGSVAEIVKSLETGLPVVIAMLISERFTSPANGVVTPGSPDADVDYHAVIAVGHGSDSTEQFILVRNSWGSSWGLGGHAWVAAAYLEPRTASITVMGAINS